MNKTTLYRILSALILAFGVTCIFWLLQKGVGTTSPSPEATSSPVTSSSSPVATTVGQASDQNLGQYSERANSSLTAAAALSGVPGCSLTFSFAPNVKVVATGGAITYTLTLHNRGTQTCRNASFSVYYSNNELFASATPKPSASDYYWAVGNMKPGATYTVSITTHEQSVEEPYQIGNEACATADNSADVCPENLVFVGDAAVPAAPSIATTPAPSVAPVASSFSPGAGEYGVWVWQSPKDMSPAYISQIVSNMKASHFNAVYVTIEDYVDIAAEPADSARTSETTSYMQALSRFVTAAHNAGLAVDVEGGARDWAQVSNRWKGYALIDFVSAYNKAYPDAKVRALQYDVESYLLPQYESSQASILSDFVAFIDGSAQRMKNVDAGFSVVIPHFYDDVIAWTPKFTYGGKNAYTFTHLLDVLQQKPGSTMTIMAYRNFFTGDNGTQDIATSEITEASTGGYRTKIIVAQETGDVQPSYVTFHGMTKKDLFSALTNIRTAFGPYANFGGVAVHYLDPYLQLAP